MRTRRADPLQSLAACKTAYDGSGYEFHSHSGTEKKAAAVRQPDENPLFLLNVFQTVKCYCYEDDDT